jgi:hypothetical protein
MTRKAPTPSSFQTRVEAKIMALQNQLVFCQQTIAGLEREIAELRRVVMAEPPRTWLTVRQAARLCGRSTVTIQHWCRHERIATYDKRQWRINRAQLRQYLIERFGEAQLPQGLREDRVL